jgi:hypothetical protein
MGRRRLATVSQEDAGGVDMRYLIELVVSIYLDKSIGIFLLIKS